MFKVRDEEDPFDQEDNFVHLIEDDDPAETFVMNKNQRTRTSAIKKRTSTFMQLEKFSKQAQEFSC
jgi:hypothetical protein